MPSRRIEYGFHKTKTLCKTYTLVLYVAGVAKVGLVIVILVATVLAVEFNDVLSIEKQVNGLIEKIQI